ncbi:hypothetical protein LEP1GSC172_2397 [Leptospira noguchii]|uniref:Uncharacterized protein n=1 Tax=Leptospira noguchii TaxID=28182 RepID=M6VC99_9LEPT|nr:hypothetical protein LEP1GSC172_2397 [Leptospira noguchii]
MSQITSSTKSDLYELHCKKFFQTASREVIRGNYYVSSN